MSRYAVCDAIQELDPEKDHQRIVFLSSCYDFPFDAPRALEFALFRPARFTRYVVPRALRLRGALGGLLPPRRHPRLRTEMRCPSYPERYVMGKWGRRNLVDGKPTRFDFVLLLLMHHMRNFKRGALAKVGLVAIGVLLHGLLFAQEEQGSAKLLAVWAGMLPVILSAPHGGREPVPGVPVRRGIGVPQFTTERDSNTAELAQAIGRALGDRLDAKPFLIVARFERKYVDANRPHAAAYESAAAKPYYEAYHRALEDAAERVRQRWMGGLLLDIHGQSAEADTIFRGTDNDRSVSALQQKFGNEALTGPKSIVGQLALKGYKVIPNGAGEAREQRYTGGYTTRTYGSHRGTQIDAIQLEIGSNLRARANLDRMAIDLADSIAVFARQYLLVVR
ncbi:MAG TPA: N-formylglutamate amidohydrolase [Candidatus Binatia bacterium]